MDNKGNIVIYQAKDGQTSIDVKLGNETVWLNRLLANVIEHKQLTLDEADGLLRVITDWE